MTRQLIFLVLSMLSVCLGCTSSADARVACPVIEMSVVADVQSDSTRPATLADGTTIQVTRTQLITNADITGASASQDGGEYVLKLDMNDAGAKRVQAFSRQNVGRTMALLLDGKVRSTPKIMGQLTGRGLQIGTFDQADAERLAKAINNGCKR